MSNPGSSNVRPSAMFASPPKSKVHPILCYNKRRATQSVKFRGFAAVSTSEFLRLTGHAADMQKGTPRHCTASRSSFSRTQMSVNLLKRSNSHERGLEIAQRNSEHRTGQVRSPFERSALRQCARSDTFSFCFAAGCLKLQDTLTSEVPSSCTLLHGE